MQIKIKKMINKITQVEVIADGDTLESCIFQVAPIVNAPTECGLCQSPKITIRTRVAKEKKTGDICLYISYFCSDCNAEMPWSQYRQPKGCFYLNKWTEKYRPDNNRNHE